MSEVDSGFFQGVIDRNNRTFLDSVRRVTDRPNYNHWWGRLLIDELDKLIYKKAIDISEQPPPPVEIIETARIGHLTPPGRRVLARTSLQRSTQKPPVREFHTTIIPETHERRVKLNIVALFEASPVILSDKTKLEYALFSLECIKGIDARLIQEQFDNTEPGSLQIEDISTKFVIMQQGISRAAAEVIRAETISTNELLSRYLDTVRLTTRPLTSQQSPSLVAYDQEYYLANIVQQAQSDLKEGEVNLFILAFSKDFNDFRLPDKRFPDLYPAVFINLSERTIRNVQ